MRFIANLFFVAVATQWAACDAFSSITKPSRANIHALYATTLEEVKKERMTEEDEDILFGGVQSSDLPNGSRKGNKSRSKTSPKKTIMPINPLDRSDDPLINELGAIRNNVQACPELWSELARACPERKALLDEHMCDEVMDLSFSQMNDLVGKSAAVFAKLGVKKGKNVAILGENSARWLIADHGIQRAGGASAVRGADAPPDELRYIYEHSDSAAIAVLQDPRLLGKLIKDAKAKQLPGLGLSNDSYGPVKNVILLNKGKKSASDIAELVKGLNVKVHVFADMLNQVDDAESPKLPDLTRDNLATIVYTSGTTGRPKGVMLTHGNLLHQLSHRLNPTKQYEDGEPVPGDIMVSLLPVWHITERTFEMWMLSRGCKVVYSSIRTFKNDMAKHGPQWMVLVPRVLEKVAAGVQDKFSSGSPAVKALSSFFTKTGNMRSKYTKIAKGLIVADETCGPLERIGSKILVAALAPINAIGDKLVWSKVKDGFGGNVKMIISGGSALAGSLETFYETCGLTVCVGYGLTECSPLIAYRRADANLVTAGCAGKPTFNTELRVVDQTSKAGNKERPALPLGEIGVVLGRGPQVMKGYYKNVEATQKAVDQFGWFDTGDLGRINPATGDLILTGRAKDTIVLSNGENIEPQPIEDEILSQSPLVDQIMLTGQDGRRLVAIIVLSANELVNAGCLTKEEGAEYQKANDKVNDPKCTVDDCDANCAILTKASAKLRENSQLQKGLMAEVKQATKGFRAWEQVGAIYTTLEPFAMANGQLTQSYKVKRDAVMQRYMDELPE